MINELNNADNATTDKYGVSVSCRIPVMLQKDIFNEATLRGISLARHLTSLIQIGHQQVANSNAEINILLREKESLQKGVNTLTHQLEMVNLKLTKQEKDEQYFAPLRRNRDLLLKYSSSGSVALKTLEQEGFDLTFVTQTMLNHGKQYFCILDMGYYHEKDIIFIKPLIA